MNFLFGHPPAHSFSCRISWSLLVTSRHYWSCDLDFAPRAVVLPVCVLNFLAFCCWWSMSLLNLCVYCTSARTTLLPWKIVECPLFTFTFKQFYEEKVGSQFSDRVLKQVFFGQTNETLDLVDYDLVVAEVLFVFGRYKEVQCGERGCFWTTPGSYVHIVHVQSVWLTTYLLIYKLDRCFTNVSLWKNAGECIHCSHEW